MASNVRGAVKQTGQRREVMTGKANQWMSMPPARQHHDFLQLDADLGAAPPAVLFSTPLMELFAGAS
jgi:hypothetical protein